MPAHLVVDIVAASGEKTCTMETVISATSPTLEHLDKNGNTLDYVYFARLEKKVGVVCNHLPVHSICGSLHGNVLSKCCQRITEVYCKIAEVPVLCIGTNARFLR